MGFELPFELHKATFAAAWEQRRPGFAFLVIFYFWPFFFGAFWGLFFISSRILKQIQEGGWVVFFFLLVFFFVFFCWCFFWGAWFGWVGLGLVWVVFLFWFGLVVLIGLGMVDGMGIQGDGFARAFG